jgi:hypothetical protein
MKKVEQKLSRDTVPLMYGIVSRNKTLVIILRKKEEKTREGIEI